MKSCGPIAHKTSLVDHFTQFNASQIPPTKNNTASNAGAQKPGKKTPLTHCTGAMYGIYTYIYMEHLAKHNGFYVGKYASPMDPMSYIHLGDRLMQKSSFEYIFHGSEIQRENHLGCIKTS